MDPILDDPQQEALRKKYFPHVEWTIQGPVRRKYRARAASGGGVVQALETLARREEFIAPGETVATCDAGQSYAVFQAAIGRETMVFGTELAAVWCDLAAGPPDENGWQPLLVRSEEAENLIALANATGDVLFKPY